MTCTAVGYMPMPSSFPYRDIFLKGRPKHEKYSPFWIKHPPMSAAHRAKIFSPFDALAGFDEAIAAKDVLYEPKRVLSEGEMEELNRKLSYLNSLTYNGTVARSNRPEVTVTYFVPCRDKNNEWYECGGLYREYTGVVQKVDYTVGSVIKFEDGCEIAFADIAQIQLATQEVEINQ